MKRLSLLLALALILAVFAACGEEAPQTSAAPGETEPSAAVTTKDPVESETETHGISGEQDHLSEKVELYAYRTAFPEGTEFISKALAAGDAGYDALKAALGDDAARLAVYEVAAVMDGNTLQPTEPVTVSIPVPAGYGENVVLYAVDENGNRSVVEATRSADGKTLTAEVTSLYRFAVAEPAGSGENPPPTSSTEDPPPTSSTTVPPTSSTTPPTSSTNPPPTSSSQSIPTQTTSRNETGVIFRRN